jgi:DNA-binding NarL/FixJ family response regulator
MWALSMLGMARGLAGQPADGYPDLIRARDASAASGDVWWQAFALWSLSVLRFVDGDDEGAAAAAKESLEVRALLEDEQFAVVLSLESLAWVAGRQHRDQRAATLIGASRRMWKAMHTSLSTSTSLNAFHEKTDAAVRARLGPRAYEAAVRRGLAMSTVEAVAMALERPGTASAAPAPAPRAGGGDFGLTKRERQVAALIAEGLSNREIAARLVVAQRTAEGHVENILSKLGFTSRAQVAGWLAAQNPPRS